MSELKAYIATTADRTGLADYYLKSEADKVIAELKAREDVLVTDNRDLLENVKKLEERLHENAEHFKRNEAQILENADNMIAELQKQVHDYAQGLYVIEERRWRNVDDKFPTADEGYILVLWEDGLPDIGYIGAEDDVIETVRDRGEGHSVKWWIPLPSAPKEEE